MPKLSGMIKEVARTLGPPVAEINMRAMMLRKEKMLSTGARGPNAPDMTPSDLATLVASVLVGGPPTHAARMTRRLLSAPIFEVMQLNKENPAFFAFLGTDRPHDFHEALSGLFAELIKMGAAGGDDESPSGDLSLSVTETPINYQATIEMEVREGEGLVAIYQVAREELGEIAPEELNAAARKMINQLGRLTTTRTIDEIALTSLAAFMRGETVDDISAASDVRIPC